MLDNGSVPSTDTPDAAGEPVRKRLPAPQRRATIIKAARAVFIARGDVGSATIRDIAKKARINEAVIYQHFASKEELFEAAIVEPLEEAVRLIRRFTRERPPVTEEEWRTRVRQYNLHMAAAMKEIGPLLGLVLFGDQRLARRFYRRCLLPEIARMAEGGRGFGPSYPGHVGSLATFGAALMLATDARYNPDSPELEEAVEQFTRLMVDGFIPPVSPGWAACRTAEGRDSRSEPAPPAPDDPATTRPPGLPSSEGEA